MHIGEALKLKIENINLDQTPTKITLPAKITKTKKPRITYISHEATNTLKEWLNYRKQYRKIASTRKPEYGIEKNDQTLFPFTYPNFTSKWKIACEKAGCARFFHILEWRSIAFTGIQKNSIKKYRA